MIPSTDSGPAKSTSVRDDRLDAVRGVAILGLIFVNLSHFASASFYEGSFGPRKESSGWETGIDFALEWLVLGKCIALLSFLFGAGLAWQQRRWGANFGRLEVRRMAVLLGFGAVHLALLSSGDILAAYALLGFTTLAAIRLPARFLRLLALAAVVAGTLVLAGLAALTGWTESGAEPDDFTASMVKMVEDVYQNGPLVRLLLVRLGEGLLLQTIMVVVLPFYFGVILLGFDAVRSGWFPGDPAAWPPFTTTALLLGGASVSALATAVAWAWPASPWSLGLSSLLGMPAGLCLAGGYLGAGLRLPPGRIRRSLARVGRMALSNYLLQSLCAAILFPFWGFGLYGRLSSSQLLFVAVGIVALQLLVSRIWLARFPLGPAEWIWRRLTHGKF